MSTHMKHAQKDAFLQYAKSEFHALDEQKALRQRDWIGPRNRQTARTKKHSRWARHQQLLAGNTQMWHLLGFTRRFDPAFLSKHPPPPPAEGQTTEEQKWKTQRAVEARSRYRLGLKYARLRDKTVLAPEQREI